MTSVERLKEYSNLPVENEKQYSKKLPNSWPSKGSLELIDVSLRYDKELPETLTSINLKIESGEKVSYF